MLLHFSIMSTIIVVFLGGMLIFSIWKHDKKDVLDNIAFTLSIVIYMFVIIATIWLLYSK